MPQNKNEEPKVLFIPQDAVKNWLDKKYKKSVLWMNPGSVNYWGWNKKPRQPSM
jgi:hypothetical protein